MVKRVMRNFNFNLGLLLDPNDVPNILDEDDYPSRKDYSEAIASGKRKVAKATPAVFYTHLYSHLFGGEVSSKFQRKIKLANGHHYKYSPDVIKRSKRGRTDVEIKSFSNSINGPLPGYVNQLENYIHTLLDRYDGAKEGIGRLDEDKIDFEYSFFRFRTPFSWKKKRDGREFKVRKHKSLAALSPSRAIKFLAENTRDVLICPSNLALLLFANAAEVSYARTTNQDASYRHIKSGDISKLHSPEGIDSFVNAYRGRMQAYGIADSNLFGSLGLEELMLDSLNVRRSHTPEIVVNGKYKIPPIRVTQYGFRDDASRANWVANLKDKYGELVFALNLKGSYEAIPI